MFIIMKEMGKTFLFCSKHTELAPVYHEMKQFIETTTIRQKISLNQNKYYKDTNTASQKFI